LSRNMRESNQMLWPYPKKLFGAGRAYFPF
jgi:hypothetical protein